MEIKKLFDRADILLERVEKLLADPQPSALARSEEAIAYRWRCNTQGEGRLQPVHQPHPLKLSDLHGIEAQKQTLLLNTQQFIRGFPCNNALLWGARGTGKSSLVKALLNEYADQGLRLIEVDAHDLVDLTDIVSPLARSKNRHLLFVDDLSFSEGDPSYRVLKAVLDGSIAVAPENVIIYATSNRRHLMPEMLKDNQETQHVEGEIHPGESVEEKVSLSERFGIWLSFLPFKQEDYLSIVSHWLQTLDGGELTEEVRTASLQWSLRRGSRSGRVAQQFAHDWVGKQKLQESTRKHSED
ncbi:MAG: ATP-binding protein [Gammaproteobacteria bacterium]|nr:ATP-binding protein [Gammaproteobacteria bacterium]